MAETRKQTSSKDVGNATDSSLNPQQDLGASDAPVANLKIKRDDFFKDLDLLVGKKRFQGGCSIGNMVEQLPAEMQTKLNEIMKNDLVQSSILASVLNSYGLTVSSSDVLRRHRRRLQGKDGCKCNYES